MSTRYWQMFSYSINVFSNVVSLKNGRHNFHNIQVPRVALRMTLMRGQYLYTRPRMLVTESMLFLSTFNRLICPQSRTVIQFSTHPGTKQFLMRYSTSKVTVLMMLSLTCSGSRFRSLRAVTSRMIRGQNKRSHPWTHMKPLFMITLLFSSNCGGRFFNIKY